MCLWDSLFLCYPLCLLYIHVSFLKCLPSGSQAPASEEETTDLHSSTSISMILWVLTSVALTHLSVKTHIGSDTVIYHMCEETVGSDICNYHTRVQTHVVCFFLWTPTGNRQTRGLEAWILWNFALCMARSLSNYSYSEDGFRKRRKSVEGKKRDPGCRKQKDNLW